MSKRNPLHLTPCESIIGVSTAKEVIKSADKNQTDAWMMDLLGQEKVNSLWRSTKYYFLLLADALSYNMQIVNKIGLKFQQNLLKVDTNIVLYQNLVKDTILQIQIDIVLYQVLFWANSRISYLLIFVLIFNLYLQLNSRYLNN